MVAHPLSSHGLSAQEDFFMIVARRQPNSENKKMGAIGAHQVHNTGCF